MKKILALLLAAMMLLTLTACKSKEQKAADKFIKELEDLIDDMERAADRDDDDKLEDLTEDYEKLLEDYEDIYDDLEDADEDAAEDFEKDVMRLTRSIKYDCDLCGEEKSGKRYKEEVLGQEVEYCKECHDSLEELADALN